MKQRINCKIGTHGSDQIVLWNDKPIKKGDVIIAMKSDLYDQFHWSFRRLKSCQYWKKYKVYDMHNNGYLFLDYA